MNEDSRYRKVKPGQAPVIDPGAQSSPFISTDGYILVTTKAEFEGAAPASAVPQILNVDDTGTYTYVGTADTGSSDSDAVWTLKRITNATGYIRYPDPYVTTNTWTGRAGLTYA